MSTETILEMEPAPPIPLPPTQDDLPSDDGIPMETSRHRMQMELLIQPLDVWFGERADNYVGGNMFVYFSPDQVRTQHYRGPDVFVALGVPWRERKSWVVWEEGKAPDVVIELLSESTATFDKTKKKDIYEQWLRVTEYFWFDPFNPDDWAGFVLERGEYRPLVRTDQDFFVSHQVGLVLMRWEGSYRGVETTWLRWATLEGVPLPVPEELAQQAQQRAEEAHKRAEEERERAEEAHKRAEEERERAERLAVRLRALGIEPDS